MYPLFEIAEITEGYSGLPQDRTRVIQTRGDVIVVVADGSGGTRGGAAAADAVVEHVASVAAADRELMEPATWMKALTQADNLLAACSIGQSTAVVAAMSACSVRGASVGDSGAWLVTANECTVLTRQQRRKPLLGDGAIPVPFEAQHQCATLLVATDGLTKYISLERAMACMQEPNLQAALSALVSSVRLRSGGLQDDIGIVLCRPGLPIKAHQHCRHNREELLAGTECGCFFCLSVLAPGTIRNWIEDQQGGPTAQCPSCGIDSVIGSSSGYPIVPEFLEAMNLAWFDGHKPRR